MTDDLQAKTIPYHNISGHSLTKWWSLSQNINLKHHGQFVALVIQWIINTGQSCQVHPSFVVFLPIPGRLMQQWHSYIEHSLLFLATLLPNLIHQHAQHKHCSKSKGGW